MTAETIITIYNLLRERKAETEIELHNLRNEVTICQCELDREHPDQTDSELYERFKQEPLHAQFEAARESFKDIDSAFDDFATHDWH